MQTAIPMKSVRMGRARYEVLGTSGACEIRGIGDSWTKVWVLYSNGAYVDVFSTKREALIYCQEHPEL